MMQIAPPARRARPLRLTPMIDVIFLLVVFFLLAARFGSEAVLDLSTAGGEAPAPGQPRLLEVGPEGLWLNGVPLPEAALADGRLADRLAGLGAAGPGATGGGGTGDSEAASASAVIVLRPVGGADVQRLIDIAGILAEAGFPRLVVVE